MRSVYFFTLHKCASSLFSSYFPMCENLTHVDYEGRIYSGETPLEIYYENDHLYGPIRISADGEFTEKVTQEEFTKDKYCIFMIRDPRDILVSQYHSFGFTHSFSTVSEVAENQSIRRQKIQSQTIDEYVLDNAETTLNDFAKLKKVDMLLRYEDLIEDCYRFIIQLSNVVRFNSRVDSAIKAASRPRKDNFRHSGEVGQHKTLLPATITELNKTLKPILDKYYL